MENTTVSATVNRSRNANNNSDPCNSNTATPAASKDEVDFVVVAHNNNNNNNINDYDISQKAKKFSNNVAEIVPKSLNTANSKSNTHTKASHGPSDNHNNCQVPSKDATKSKWGLFSSAPVSAAYANARDDSQPVKKNSTKERLSLFSFGKRSSHKAAHSHNSNNNKESAQRDKDELVMYKPASLQCALPPVPIGTPPRQHKFVKSSSIARLLGNTYHAKKFEKQEQKRQAKDAKFHTYGGRRRSGGPYLERFKRYSKEDGDEASPMASTDDLTLPIDMQDVDAGHRNELGEALEHFHDNTTTVPLNEELGAKTMRTISRGLGKLWWKRTHSVDISTPDPEFKVSYLGNVLTGWAKGEGCVEKQLNTLWRNYTQNNKPDVIMRIKVCASGLKATTRQHGLTEYWANRITHCCAPTNYPRVFCWIYRHEGRKLKHELRCHAVLCSKEKVVQELCNTLKENLECALREFKREKILKQNARLSLANAAYENPSLPRRKILLSVGGNNYRPPLERSKSAPKLMAIEEAIGEEDGDEVEETNEPEMRPCCQKDSLYPAMTLGRRRCRRGHSIRRTGKTRPTLSVSLDETQNTVVTYCCHDSHDTKETATTAAGVPASEQAPKNPEPTSEQQRHSYGSDDSDDFEKLLKYNNYDTNASLATELLPYFDMQLHKNTSSSLSNLSELKDEEEPLSLLPTINSDPSAHPEGDLLPAHNDTDNECVGLRRNGVCSDGEEDYLDDDMYFRQASMLNMLHRNSMRKMANYSLSSDESSLETSAPGSLQYRHQMQSSISSNASSTTTNNSSVQDGQVSVQGKQLNADSDEGSISSGCETASTVTANQDDISLQYRNGKQLQQPLLQTDVPQLDTEQGLLHNDDAPITAEAIYQRLESRLQRRQNSDATTFSSSSSITLKMSGGAGSSPTESLSGVVGGGGEVANNNGRVVRRQRRPSATQQQQQQREDTDSECSDESGYVEYQERDRSARESSASEGGHSTAAQQQQLQRQQSQQSLKSKPQLPPKPMPRRLLSAPGNGVGNGSSTAV